MAYGPCSWLGFLGMFPRFSLLGVRVAIFRPVVIRAEEGKRSKGFGVEVSWTQRREEFSRKWPNPFLHCLPSARNHSYLSSRNLPNLHLFPSSSGSFSPPFSPPVDVCVDDQSKVVCVCVLWSVLRRFLHWQVQTGLHRIFPLTPILP